MSSAQANVRAAVALVDELARAGVTEACVAPGSRSAPIALAVAKHPRMRDWVVIDERSAAFFALGLARGSGRPALVLSTSGTATANLAPAITEASLARVPMIVVTADRPTELRDAGAPQTIRQAALFSAHARWSVDAPVPDVSFDLDRYFRTLACRLATTAIAYAGPVHLNLPFREPLWDEATLAEAACTDGGREDGRPYVVTHERASVPCAEEIDRLAARLARHDRGLIVCGPDSVDGNGVGAIQHLASRLAWPLLADGVSGVRSLVEDARMLVDAHDVMLRNAGFSAGHRPTAVLRFGLMPTSKALARFLATSGAADDVSVLGRRSPEAWSDPDFAASDVVEADAGLLAAELAARTEQRRVSAWTTAWLDGARAVRAALEEHVRAIDEPFEGAVAQAVMAALPAGGILFAGNSMPVRDVETFASARAGGVRAIANRGANGIDGVTSTALGVAAASGRPTVLLTGDLSFLHDLGALQLARAHSLALVAVVVNNDGGGIFSFLPRPEPPELFERMFGTPHGLDLSSIARAFGARTMAAETGSQVEAAIGEGIADGGLVVVEVRTDRERNIALHRECIEHALVALDACAEAAA